MESIHTFAGFNSHLREFISRCREDEDRFNQLALALFSLQFVHVEPYRRLCAARRVTPDGIAHWNEIPPMPTAAFKEMDVTSLPPDERTHEFHSSGTSGQMPGRHFHSVDSIAIYEASLLTWFEVHLRAGSERFTLVNLTPSPALAPHSSLAHMFEIVRREYGSPDSSFVGTTTPDGSWSLDLSATLRVLERSVDVKRPVTLLGTAFSFVHLVDEIAARGLIFALPPGSRVMETGGYKGRSRALPKTELHRLLTRYLGIPAVQIVCEYGMSELSSQAYDGRTGIEARADENQSRLFRFPPWARALIISPETGREARLDGSGLIQVHDLANVRSVMAIQTEDLAVRRKGGFELIGRVASAEPRGCSLMTA